jgi:hypothetical protein
MRRLVVIGLFELAAAGCITPSIPIPPPDPAAMTFTLTVVDTSSTAVFRYPVEHNYHNGVVYVYNRSQGTGVIQNVNADDSIGPTNPFPAIAGDEVVISVETVAQTESTCVKLRDGTGQDSNSCTF